VNKVQKQHNPDILQEKF